MIFNWFIKKIQGEISSFLMGMAFSLTFDSKKNSYDWSWQVSDSLLGEILSLNHSKSDWYP